MFCSDTSSSNRTHLLCSRILCALRRRSSLSHLHARIPITIFSAGHSCPSIGPGSVRIGLPEKGKGVDVVAWRHTCVRG
eukprot:3017649-Rhodomonas_salina.4